MNKTLITICLALLLINCKKSSNNSGNGSPSNPNLDSENFITIDGVTNYHYIYPNHPSVKVQCVTTGSSTMYFWSNQYQPEPDLGATVMLNGPMLNQITHRKNGTLTTYYPRIWTPLNTKTINGLTVIEFKDMKAYKVQTDTTKGYVLVNGKFTCNGK